MIKNYLKKKPKQTQMMSSHAIHVFITLSTVSDGNHLSHAMS